MKLQKHLKWKMKKTRQELGSFYKLFDVSTRKPDCGGTRQENPRNPYQKRRKPYKPYRSKNKYYKEKPRNNKYKKPEEAKPSSSKPDLKNVTYYKCGRKGHISKYCRIKKKLHELELSEEVLSKLEALLV